MTASRASTANRVASTEPGAAQGPDAERLISDPDTMKALADPLRLRILETLVTRVDEPWSAKELAARLGVPQTRLYHHLELLLERDLVRVAEQRVVSGIIETRYRVAAMSFRLDRRLLAGDADGNDAGREVLHTVFDTARDDVARALQRFLGASTDQADLGDPGVGEEPDRPIVSRGLALLTPEQAARFRERLAALIREFDADGESAEAEPWGLLVAFYRHDAKDSESSHA